MEPQTLELAISLLADLCSVSEFYRTHRSSNFIQNIQDSIKAQTPLDRQLIHDCTSLSHDLLKEIHTVMELPLKHYKYHENQTTLTPSETDISEEEKKKLVAARKQAEALVSGWEKLVDFSKQGMTHIAPNLFVYVGSETAARLISAAGGLERLSNMSVADVLSLGATDAEKCYVERSSFFRRIPLCWTQQARNLVANKVILAARADFEGVEKSGGIGRRLAKEVESVVMGRWEKKLTGSKGSPGEVISQARVSVARNDVKFKCRSRRAVSRAAESLALALEGIEIADGEKNARKGSGNGN